MAFGKDTGNLKNVSAYGAKTLRQVANKQQAAQQASRPPKGGQGAFWRGAFKPPFHKETRGRLIAGSYDIATATSNGTIEVVEGLPYFTYTEHFDGRNKRGSICSAGPFMNFKDKRDPCYGCDMFYDSMEVDPQTGKRRPGRVSKRDLYSFTWMHYGTFFKVDRVDKNGQLVLNQNTGKPYYDWVEGSPKNPKFAGKESMEGQLMHWPMGYTHFKTLLEYDRKIGKSCAACGTKDSIESVAWVCGKCGEAVIEMDSTTLEPQEVQQLTEQPTRCPSCGHEDYLEEVIECAGCSNPVRATLFDVDLDVQRLQASDGGNQTSLMISGWSAPRPIPEKYKEKAKSLDLDKIYAPTPLEEQERIFGISSSRRQPVTSATREYGNDDDDDEQDD